MKYLLATCLILVSLSSVFADGPADNNAATVRPIPPVGIELNEQQSDQLLRHCAQVRQAWDVLLSESRAKANTDVQWQKARFERIAQSLVDLTPEILVFPRAVEMALEFNQFYQPRELETAAELLDEAMRRIEVAREHPVWSRVVGIDDGEDQQLIVGGYRSKIDSSFQPYALVVPPGFSHGDSRPRRLDLWFHGRGETLSEVKFLSTGKASAGQYTPADTFVLHPYGRYSNAFKFAGEVDVLEALDYLSGRLPVDASRVSARGFSMGGAACWQFATHYADRFFAANPGAGFSETPEFLKSFQGEDLAATPEYQRTLWRLYDCPHWARNLVHCPTVAYSGEIDKQKQAADVMQQSLADHGIELVHVIGPQTAHKIHADSKVEIERRMDAIADSVTPDLPLVIDLTTQTLRYNRMHWVVVQGLQQHWQTARVVAKIATNDQPANIIVSTTNVDRLRFEFDAGQWPGGMPDQPTLRIDETIVKGPPVRSDRSWSLEVVLDGDQWTAAPEDEAGLRKKPGLQGPIDDAFMDSFLFVLPGSQSGDSAFQKWAVEEAQHAQLHWRKHFRGDVQRVTDRQLTKQQIATHNLILFGDPESNSAIARLADGLPVKWTADQIQLGKQVYSRSGHAVAMIYPNPLNPDRYIVLNSGFTFREYDYLNNARQTPKLPDWAVIDITGGATYRDPGVIKAAGFFDERWRPLVKE